MSLIGVALSSAGFAKSLFGRSGGNRFVMAMAPVMDSDGNQQLSGAGVPIFHAFDVYIAMSEDHFDEMHITDNPVAQGTTISDHAFAIPARLTMVLAWSPSTSGSGGLKVFGVTLPTLSGLFVSPGAGGNILKAIYTKVLAAMRARQFVNVSTGKRLYKNMLIQSVGEMTNAETENALLLTVVFKEMLLAKVNVIKTPVNTDAGGQADPESTTPPEDRGAVAPSPAKLLPGAAPVIDVTRVDQPPAAGASSEGFIYNGGLPDHTPQVISGGTLA